MVRFLHTADWQMGMKAEHVGEAAERLRQVRLDAARKVVEVARGHQVDFILVAGDTFEDNGVSRVLVQQVADILADFGGPVYVIAGNHDPLTPGSVWEDPAWEAAGNIFLLKDPEPVSAGPALLYPCPAKEKYCRADPTAWIDAAGRKEICIGLAHGTLEEIAAEEPDFPIPADAACLRGLDYLALGHWHSTHKTADSRDDAVRLAYSGTHEPTRFGERDSGNVLVVRIEDRGAPPEVTQVPTGIMSWEKLERRMSTLEDYRGLISELESRPGADRTLLWVALEGLLPAGATGLLERLDQLLAARFFHGRLDTAGLAPSPEDSTWIDALPAGYLRQAAGRLLEQATGPDPDSALVARKALEELFVICREAGR